MEENMEDIDENQAREELENGYDMAVELLKDKEKTEEFLQRLEKKLKVIPKLGNTLSMIPVFISLVRNYIRKEYTTVPLGTIVAIVSALIYVLSPLDLIPDSIPGAGYIDDTLVITACLKLVGSDIYEYQKWREKNNKLIDE